DMSRGLGDVYKRQECNEVNNLNIKLDSEYLNKDSLYKLAQHTEKMDTSIESLGSNRKIILINYH
ncbi:hypothetical protein QJ515_12810, partial [Acinetobacter baumannii]|nr:hypothetical protein [Acinetobacter baumannii]